MAGIDKYNRERLWSTGTLMTDMTSLINDIENVDEKQLELGIQKLGDIAGCPVPDLVAQREGYVKAINYLHSLVEDYNYIKDYLKKNNIPWRIEWGKEEKRKEPAGEFSSRIPTKILDANIIRGPGKYHEFSITRLIWVLKCDSNVHIQAKELDSMIDNTSSMLEFHVQVLVYIAKKMVSANFPGKKIVESLLLGIAHIGFFKQNHAYYDVTQTLELLREYAKDETWLALLEAEVNKVLNISP